MKKVYISARSISLVLILLVSYGLVTMAEAGEKLSVGLVEEVVLLPWGVRLPARVDTGAAMTSLDARNIEVKDGVAHFNLPEKYGGLAVTLPVVGYRHVRSAAARSRRPVVEVELCVGPRRLKVKANLTDRSGLTYPVLLGRNLLQEGYVVDCDHMRCLPPSCPDLSTR